MAVSHPLKIAKLADASRVEFGPLSFYHPLVADGDTPVRTGIQTANPGYQATMHWHPYTELLFIIEGEAEVWLEGEEPHRLKAGDCVAVPPETPHTFRVVGQSPLRLLGIHANAARYELHRPRERRARLSRVHRWRTNLNSTLSVV